MSVQIAAEPAAAVAAVLAYADDLETAAESGNFDEDYAHDLRLIAERIREVVAAGTYPPEAE